MTPRVASIVSLNEKNLCKPRLSGRVATVVGVRILGSLVTVGALAAGPWAKAPSLPTPRSAHAVVVAGGAIHVLGGPGTRRIDRFNGRKWAQEARLPGETLNAPAAVALGRKLYVIGGFGGSSNLPTARVRVFDLASKKWTQAAPLPGARGGHAAVVLDGRIHVLGGGNDVSTLASHSVYDPATNRWSAAAPMPIAAYWRLSMLARWPGDWSHACITVAGVR
jgi:hypothetical protein